MWCDHCRCEVPVDFAPDGDEIRCGVCQALMPGAWPEAMPTSGDAGRVIVHEPATAVATEAGETGRATVGGQAIGHEPIPPAVDWELQRDLRQASWLLRSTVVSCPEDPARELGPPWPESSSHSPSRSSTWAQCLCGAMLWLVVCVGAMGLAFGGGLLGCTIIGQRGDLWNWGLLTALAGQLVLFLGIAGLLFLRVLKKSSLRNAPLAMADLASAPFTHPPRLPWSQRCDAALALRLDDPR